MDKNGVYFDFTDNLLLMEENFIFVTKTNASMEMWTKERISLHFFKKEE